MLKAMVNGFEAYHIHSLCILNLRMLSSTYSVYTCIYIATVGWLIASPNLHWPLSHSLPQTAVSIFTCIIYHLGIKMQRNAH